METLKFDAPLSALLARAGTGPRRESLDISVRTRGLLSSQQVDELASMGVNGADTQRSIFPARVPLAALHEIAAKPWVLHVSLAQPLRPLTSEKR